jgi:hypothetical protein
MNYYERVLEREIEQADLFKRMITDKDLLYLKNYVLRDKESKAVPDIINLTLNKPAIFAANVISALGATSQQTVVTSAKGSLDTHYIEEFQEAALNAADNRLQRKGQASLNSFTDVQLCIRGRAARRVLFRMDEGEIIPDIVSWDTRYVTHERGDKGLKWGAYHIDRNWAATEEQYGQLMVKYGVYREGEKKVKANIEGKQVLEQGHDYGFCPVVLEIVPLGYGNILMEEDRLTHEGESIFFMIRDVIPEMNRLVSLLQTLNQRQLLAPMKFTSEDDQKEAPDFPKSMEVLNVGKGDIAPIDYGDVRKSAEMLYTILEKSLQQGSISDIDLGNLNFPMSAVAIVTIGEGKDQIYLPRLNTKALINQRTAEMITQQVLQLGESSVELGTPGHKKSFNTAKLEGEYETSYKYFVKSPKIDIARLTMGDAALKMGVDRETVYTDILQYEDPKGMIQKYYSDQAELMNPMVKINRIIRNLTEKAERDGDEDAAEDAYIMQVTMGQMMQGGQPQIEEPPTGNVSQPMPLMGDGGKVGGVKASPAQMGGAQ